MLRLVDGFLRVCINQWCCCTWVFLIFDVCEVCVRHTPKFQATRNYLEIVFHNSASSG